MKRKIVVNKKIVIPALLILMLVIIGGVTYAYFTAGVEGNNEAKNAVANTGVESLKYDGTSVISLEDALPGAYHEIKFSIENIGTLPTKYQIDLVNVVNTFVNDELVYTLTLEGKEEIDEKVMPYTDATLIDYETIEIGDVHNYTLTLHFKETGKNQNSNQGAAFAGIIQINNLDNTNLLAANILRNNTVSTKDLNINEMPLDSALYKVEDDDGTSYLYRGNVTNNYVDLGTTYTEDLSYYIVGLNTTNVGAVTTQTLEEAYAECEYYYEFNYSTIDICKQSIVHHNKKTGDKMLWRIVRINGDKTIRLITDDIVGKSQYNLADSSEEYVGYTYFVDDVETDSTIKNYLDSWYSNNLSIIDEDIAQSTFCNDTVGYRTADSYVVGYIADSRIQQSIPSLKCGEIPHDVYEISPYGGKYSLKVGLLTVDEANLAGYKYNDWLQFSSYLWNLSDFWTMSPRIFLNNASLFYASYGGELTGTNTNATLGVRPVINLKNNIIITGGDGTVSNPYTIN